MAEEYRESNRETTEYEDSVISEQLVNPEGRDSVISEQLVNPEGPQSRDSVVSEQLVDIESSEKVVEQKSLNARIWGIGVRQIVFMALGAALYAGVSYATNTLQLPGASNVSLRPGIVIPVFFGVVFGPWVGLFTGAVGNIINDLLTGPLYWNWDLGNGLIGFVAGLSMYITFGRYRSIRGIVIAEALGIVGIIVGLGFAAYTDIWVSALTPLAATVTEFIPATIPDIILSVILLPILLVAYNAAVARTGRA